MSKEKLITLLLTASLLMASGGCATDMARVDYDNKINTAFAQLQDGRPSQALKNLELAGKIGEENGYDKTELKQLFVEANLGLGNNVEAYAQAKELLDSNPQDAYANELMGKVLLKEGQYSEAEKYFTTAQAGYEAPMDSARVSDLITLARYFAAYEEANPRLADGYLREIQNADLQLAVDKAQKDIIIKDLY